MGRRNEKWLIEVTDGGETQQIEATHVIVATGSSPRPLPGVEVDNVRVLDNAGALAMTGAGPPGRDRRGRDRPGNGQRGSAWALKSPCWKPCRPSWPPWTSKSPKKRKYLTKDTGLVIHNGVKIGAIENGADAVTVKYELNGQAQELVVDKLIVAIGRVPTPPA